MKTVHVTLNYEGYEEKLTRARDSSATILVLLDELNRTSAFKTGDKVVLSGFGAGLTYGACVMIW